MPSWQHAYVGPQRPLEEEMPPLRAAGRGEDADHLAALGQGGTSVTWDGLCVAHPHSRARRGRTRKLTR
jgi:hypothetical protein